jgi:hypothetical protein
MDSDLLRAMLCKTNHQLGRNKALYSAWPLRFAAVDGHDLFPSRNRHCSQCLKRKIKIGDIENKNFNSLGRHWALNHCFKHEPTAIVNFILTLFIAFVLVQSFYRRNLKPQVRALFGTLVAIADELYVSLCVGRARTALLECHAQPPP